MHAILSAGALLAPLLVLGYTDHDPRGENGKRYVALSRHTDPKDEAALLDDLPEDVRGIVAVANAQLSSPEATESAEPGRHKPRHAARSPQLAAVLKALKKLAPHNLQDRRRPGEQVAAGPRVRAYFLAGLFRYRLIPARVRAGFLAETAADGQTVLKAADKPDRRALAAESPGGSGERDGDACSAKPGDGVRYAEYWACECWDGGNKRWLLPGVDGAAPKARDPSAAGRRHFEFAAETWKRMRRGEKMVFDEYDEGAFDYRTVVRARLLWDFASLLNHDPGEEAADRSRGGPDDKRFGDLSARELRELDQLAELLLHDPTIDDLVLLYRKCPTLRMPSAESDPFSYVFQ